MGFKPHDTLNLNSRFANLSNVESQAMECYMSPEEIRNVVWSCGSNKASGCDSTNIIRVF